jgi:predicted ester cyclase
MDHAATLRRMYDSINVGDVDAFGDHLAEDFLEHEATPTQDSTKAGAKALIKMMIGGFPDLGFNAEDVMSVGDKVVARARVTGTNTGTFMGMSPTGKGVDVQLIDILRFGDDGLVHEHWGVMDTMSMMQQLGVVPQGPLA